MAIVAASIERGTCSGDGDGFIWGSGICLARDGGSQFPHYPHSCLVGSECYSEGEM
jgi:hypothetical protein